MKKTPAIMFQGTGSGVGKSLLTAGLCRLLSDMGYRAAPFKAQNMALNSGVVKGSLEMGRAQILQAEAAGIEPDVRMNPILLKPQGNSSSQLVRMGKVTGVVTARDYYTLSEENFEIVKRAYDSLASEYDIIVIEGAGSPAEINLQKTDIVNMRMAEYADADVYIIGDIDRGGVFAWMKGTYDLLQEKYKSLVKGFIINRFRGDVSLLKPGIEMFNEYVPVPVEGVVPYLRLTLEEEDSQDITSDKIVDENITVGVVKLPRISNFSDFAPLKSNRKINLLYIDKPEMLNECDMVILPGSKSTAADMSWLRESGFSEVLQRMTKPLLGICGGFQMMGNTIADPMGLEGSHIETEGLGIFEMKTSIEPAKKLEQKSYQGAGILKGLEIAGYEMHMGKTYIAEKPKQLVTEQDIFIYDDNRRAAGTYLHGIFESGKITEKIFSAFG